MKRRHPSAALVIVAAALLFPSFTSLASSADDGQKVPGALSVAVEPNQVRIAEPLQLTIRVRSELGGSYRLPETLDLGPFVELSRSQDTESSDAGKVAVFRLKIASYEETGELAVPGFKLLAGAEDGGTVVELEVPSVTVKVRSVLEGVEKPEPRDIAGPVSIRLSDYRPLVFLGLGILWLLAGLLLRWLGDGLGPYSRLTDLPPARPAHQIAYEKLHGVVEEDLLRQGRFQDYFIRVSEVVREYLGNRYGFFAMDLTSRELLEELRDRPTPGLEHGTLAQLLQEADLVKFACLRPSDEMSSRAINGAFALVEATKQVLREQEAK